MASDPSQGVRMDAMPTAEMFTAISSLLCVLHLEPGSDCMTVSPGYIRALGQDGNKSEGAQSQMCIYVKSWHVHCGFGSVCILELEVVKAPES